MEHENEAYYKLDPDPFDDWHLGKSAKLPFTLHTICVLYIITSITNTLGNVMLGILIRY